MTNIGTFVFPAPRKIPARQCDSASRKKNSPSVLACSTPKAITSGSLLKNPTRTGANRTSITPVSSASEMPAMTPNLAPYFTLSYFSAPRFCPMKVVSAMLKLVIGRKAKPSSFE